MYYQNPYWYWTDAVDDKWIKKIHTLVKKKNLKSALVGTELREDENIRKSKIAFIEEEWVSNKLKPFIDTANKSANWNFEWFRMEAIQYTEYGLNEFYNYHLDSHVVPTKNNRQRKVSVVVSLNNSSEYEGGQFKMMLDPNRVIEVKELKRKGTVIVFPSNIWHKVEPITKGKRYSLVGWCEGFDFK
jgi:PKHD-type hydroxylase